MTRTAADVQAEIDALAEREEFAAATAEADARQLKAFGWTEEALQRMVRSSKRLAAWGEQSKALEDERDRLARAELDAATPPQVRAEALRLRAVYRSAEEWAIGAEDAWEALETSEAAAWAAVAREAGR